MKLGGRLECRAADVMDVYFVDRNDQLAAVLESKRQQLATLADPMAVAPPDVDDLRRDGRGETL